MLYMVIKMIQVHNHHHHHHLLLLTIISLTSLTSLIIIIIIIISLESEILVKGLTAEDMEHQIKAAVEVIL